MLTVAVQMDPLDSINIAGDSTFALMLSAQARGHRLLPLCPRGPELQRRRGLDQAHPVTVQRVAGNHFSFGDPVSLDLGDERTWCDAPGPALDLGYITTATHLLERIADRTLEVNDPAMSATHPKKVVGARFRAVHAARSSPARSTRPRRSLPNMARSSSNRSTAMAAKAIFKIGRDWGQPLLADRGVQHRLSRAAHGAGFLPDIVKGDKRIVLVDGEVAARSTGCRAKARSDRILPSADPRRRPNSPTGRRKSALCWGRVTEEARAPFRRHRRYRRAMADRNQRHLSDRNRRDRPVQRSDTAGMIWDAIERRVAARR